MNSTILKFIGTGACFNTKFGNTSAFYYEPKEKHLFLIDCGETVFSSIRYSHILNEAQFIDILITHLHSDHAGSLESLIYFCKFHKNITPTVIFPDVYEIASHLKRVSKEFYNLVTPNEYKKFNIIYLPQHHAIGLDAYGYLLTINNTEIFYSGDSKTIDKRILNLLQNGNITHFYQDVSKFNSPVHMSIEELAKIIPIEKRKFITCMHFDDSETVEIAKKLGFKVAKRATIK